MKLIIFAPQRHGGEPLRAPTNFVEQKIRNNNVVLLNDFVLSIGSFWTVQSSPGRSTSTDKAQARLPFVNSGRVNKDP